MPNKPAPGHVAPPSRPLPKTSLADAMRRKPGTRGHTASQHSVVEWAPHRQVCMEVSNRPSSYNRETRLSSNSLFGAARTIHSRKIACPM
jgi:hypothetical protein